MSLREVEEELEICKRSDPNVVRRLGRALKEAFDPASDEGPEALTTKEEARIICGQEHFQVQDTDPKKARKASLKPEYIKIFAILALIGRPSSITSFFGVFGDDRLPLDAGPSLIKNFTKELPSPFKSKQWSPWTVRKFARMQWTVLSPTFCGNTNKEDVPHYPFKPCAVLPFTSSLIKYFDNNHTGSEVARTEIHPHHHDFSDDNGVSVQVVAVKKLLGGRRRQLDFQREAATLRRMNKHKHKHIVRLLATFEQNKEYYFVFPWAGADLHHYWECVKPHPSENDRLSALDWVAEQCEGLASGLTHIHRHCTFSNTSLLNHSATLSPSAADESQRSRSKTSAPGEDGRKDLQLYGRHGDIKPRNILWFPDECGQGTLKITDFGVSEFKKQALVEWQSRDPLPITPTYAPPESRLEIAIPSPCFLYDIWSLGCVYLEFLAWWFGGWNMVQDFATSRFATSRMVPGPAELFRDFRSDTYFEVQNVRNQEKAVVKEAVSKVSPCYQKPWFLEFSF
ncbi:hypothetical protein N0V93_004404 [Gnomoniopsis smithogilvyi]|uniref:Protein kinase domain-containing protein n=1 Tax=Gnomoniopsis smithogilvyi TaxID=1191159 RepID=A0A9W8YR10_9PEZI|nr:hypothetical protein N0V93_004404 [Gnomoniopsis smithogilvyi]